MDNAGNQNLQENQDVMVENEFEQIHKKNRKGQIISVFFLLILTGLVLYVLFRNNDFGETMKAITSAKGVDLLLAMGCLIAFIALTPVSLCILCKAKKTKISSLQCYLIGASEHFFNNITPYQTGAQPFQVYSFSKGKVKAAEGTGLVICNYISFLIALNSMILFSLVFSKDFFGNYAEKKILWIPILGVVMNLFTLVLFLCLVTCRWVRNFFKKALRFFCKISFIGKKLGKSIPSFDSYCDKAQLGAKEVLKNPGAFFLAVLLRFAALLFYYAIPFYILRSLGVHVPYYYFFYTILATCFAVNAVVWIPTPGTSGGIEMSFTVLFAIFSGFSGAVAAAAAILWRALTYYLLMIISFLQYLILEIVQKRQKAKELKQAQ